MSYNGSGVAQINSTGQPVAASTLIEASVFNAFTADVATMLSTVICKDGQTTVTANLPMATFRHTGVGAGASRTDYARVAEVQDGAITKITSVAGTNTITATAPLSMAAYVVGQEFTFIPAATNTGAATLNINSIGAGAVQQGGKALVGGELKISVPVRVLVTAATPVFEIVGSGALFGPHVRADIASATTLDLDATLTHSLNVTGTTATIGMTLADGACRILRANAAWPITHGASLICPGSASYTCAAGDLILAIGEPAGVVRLAIWKADGTAVVASGAAKVQDFRLTLTTGVPVTTADVTGATTVYCTPYKGNQIALYDGANWNVRSSAEFSLALGTLTSGKPYDIFCYDNSGVPTLEFLVWTNDTTRATALAYQDGVLVKSGAATRRYLGTFYTTSTTQTEDSAANRLLFNYYHRVKAPLKKVDSTAMWTYGTTTWRSSNASDANRVTVMQGVAEDEVSVENQQFISTSTTTRFSIGFDTTSASSADIVGLVETTGRTSAISRLKNVPAAGYHYYQAVEYSSATGTYHGAYGGLQSSGLTGEFMR